MPLDDRQRKQVEAQLVAHRHDDYTVDLVFDDLVLNNFSVRAGVYRPDVMIARSFGTFLRRHRDEFVVGKRFLDMGCGSGVLGLVLARSGVHKGCLSDISPLAVANARENVRRFLPGTDYHVIQGDLFERVEGRFDLIVFNHPFFPAPPIPEVPVSRSMLDPGPLLERFLGDARRHLDAEGTILMPYLRMAGPTNDPGLVGPRLGYRVDELQRYCPSEGLQTGDASIYSLRLRAEPMSPEESRT